MKPSRAKIISSTAACLEKARGQARLPGFFVQKPAAVADKQL